MNLLPIVKRDLYGKAIPDLFVFICFGSLGVLHLGLMFLIGTWLGPFILWFLNPIPPFVPILSGVILLIVLFVSAIGADYRYWTSVTYDSKSLGEIPLSEAPWRLHSYASYNALLMALGLPSIGGAGLPADMQVFAPASVNMMTKMFSMPLLVGPALVLAALRRFREACRLLSFDTKRLSALLAFTYSQGGRVAFTDLCNAFPDFRVERDAAMLSYLDGVIILHKEMQGIALADRLKKRIGDIAEQSRCSQ